MCSIYEQPIQGGNHIAIIMRGHEMLLVDNKENGSTRPSLTGETAFFALAFPLEPL